MHSFVGFQEGFGVCILQLCIIIAVAKTGWSGCIGLYLLCSSTVMAIIVVEYKLPSLTVGIAYCCDGFVVNYSCLLCVMFPAELQL